MTTTAVGIDIVRVGDLGAAIERFGERFLRRLFTERERADCAGPVGGGHERLAGRFAAKEAAIKALTLAPTLAAWREIEVDRSSREPRLVLHGAVAERARLRALTSLSVSLSHEREYAVAAVMASFGAAAATRAARVEDADATSAGDPGATSALTSRLERTTRAGLAAHAGLVAALDDLAADVDLWTAGMTSLASVNVMLALEDAFAIEFPERMLVRATFTTIDSIVRAVAELAAADGAVAP